MEAMTGPVAAGIILVCGKDDRLLGVVVDSDLRKAMLRGLGLEAPLSEVMNPRPFTLPAGLEAQTIVQAFQEKPRASIPLVDPQGRVRGLAEMAHYLAQRREKANRVVLLVGGTGTRLHPLTQERPKPLLRVGNKPLLETIIEQFLAAGFHNFLLAVNHHAEQIRKHFGDGSAFHADIGYLQEDKPLGTAGPLSLLPQTFQEPLIVMNGDLLTKIDFQGLLDFHNEEKNLATVCVREYDFQVPYGVVRMEDHRLREIVEKPTHRFFVNAGIYVLDPRVLPWVPQNRRYDMPDLLEKIRRRRKASVGCFPIREYWIDIGRMDDYERAQAEYAKFF